MKERRRGTIWVYWFSLAIAIMFVYKGITAHSTIGTGFGKLISTLMPFLLGILIAYLFYIPCRGIEKTYRKTKFLKKHARGFAIFTVYIMAILIITFVVNIIFPALSKSLTELVNSIPGFYQRTIDFVNDLPDDGLIKKENIQEIVSNFQQLDITQFFSAEKITSYIKGAMGVASTIFNVFVTIIMSVYILIERGKIRQFIINLNNAIFKKETADKIDYYFDKTNEIFFRFISTQIFDGILVGIIISIALAIMKVKYAVLLGFMIGLFNLIPYFGAIVAVVISVLITIFTGGISKAIWMLIVIVILQQIDANIINPKLLGSALEISPILVIFSVTLLGTYCGVLGMFLAVPIVSVLKLLVMDYIDSKNNKSEEKIDKIE